MLEEYEKDLEQIQSLVKVVGIGTVLLIVILILGGILFWRFLIKRTEILAEEISKKNLKVFQAELDKGLVKYSSKHQRQIDAVQDCYQSFQELFSLLNYVVKGEKFTAQMNPNDEVKNLSEYRLNFKRSYAKNKILFPKELNMEIESLMPEIDSFIEEYIKGLMPVNLNDDIPEEYRSPIQIAGIWPRDKLIPTLNKMDKIRNQIELEFRKVYGIE